MPDTVSPKPPAVLYDPAVVVPGSTPAIRAWKPDVAGIREVLHARFTDHAYPPHTHDVWTLFVVDAGAIRYDLDGQERAAEPTMVSILPPHVVHDGRPASSGGYRKRVLYLEPNVLDERLIGPAVDRPAVLDEGLRREVTALHDALACPDDAFEAEIRLSDIVERITSVLGEQPAEPSPTAIYEHAEELRAFLDAHLFEQVTIGSAAEVIGGSPTHLARAFSTVFGLPPHAYLLGRRLEAARDRILRGQALADVAAEVGFYDQAHLSRRFRRFLGTTPGRFRAGSRST
jgi:AraC-like DNA-binding protein